MSKKILDAAVTAAFCICLIAAPNIQEKEEKETRSSQEDIESFQVKKSGTAIAGVFEELSGYSFTTESGEKTEIEKNEFILVTSQEKIIENDRNYDETIPVSAQVSQDVPMPEEMQTQQTEPALAEQTVQTQSADAADDSKVQEASSIIRNRWNISLTQDEIDLLARIVWLEANGEPVAGQEAVVEVVFNRMTSDLYPNTLYDVLSQKNPVQFCSWKNRNQAQPTDKEYQSIERVLDGNTSILRNDTLYFSTKPLTSNTDVRIGGHSFCY